MLFSRVVNLPAYYGYIERLNAVASGVPVRPDIRSSFARNLPVRHSAAADRCVQEQSRIHHFMTMNNFAPRGYISIRTASNPLRAAGFSGAAWTGRRAQ